MTEAPGVPNGRRRAPEDAVERHLEVRRTARLATLGPWDDPAGAGTDDVWIVLHGYGQLARRFLRRFRPLHDGRRLVVAPEALSRFYVRRERGRHGPDSLVGGTWMTREDREREIDDYVAYLDRVAGTVFGRLDRDAVRFTLLGFSQGLHTAARWATLGAWPPDRLVLWGDYLPPDLPMEQAAERFRGRELVLVRGTEDRSRRDDLARDEAARLEASRISHTVREHPGGHDVDRELLLELAER